MRPSVMFRSRFLDEIPPIDRGWLVSTWGDLKAEEYKKREYTDRWLTAHPFPGADASYEAKVAWLAALQKEQSDELDRSGPFNFTLVPEAFEIPSEVLLKEAPDRIVVEFHVNLEDLDRIKDLSETQKSRFASGLAKHGRNGYKGEANWEAYKAFLLENDYGSEARTVIGTIECSKDDKFEEICRNFVRNLGIDVFVYRFMEVDRVACSGWGLMPLVGNNLYCPLPDKSMCYPVLMRLKTPTDIEKAENEFENGLDAIQEATKATSAPKTFVLVPTKEAEEIYGAEDEEPPQLHENYHVLWLPQKYIEEEDRIKPHFECGKGETRQIQNRMDKGNTDSGNLKAEIFRSEFQFIKELPSWQTRFCAALALTWVAAGELYWAHDNECPDEVAKMIKELAAYWRTTLLKKDDKTLGLGLGSVDEENVDASAMSESRKALYRFLEVQRTRFESASDGYYKIKFNYMLGHSRNPKTLNSQNKKFKTGGK